MQPDFRSDSRDMRKRANAILKEREAARVFRAVLIGCIVMIAAMLGGCDKIEFLLNRDTDPESVAKGLPGIWEIEHIKYNESEYMVYDAKSGQWKNYTKPAFDLEVKDKNSKYYSTIKVTNSTFMILNGADVIPGAELAKEYPYTLTEDSIVHSDMLPLRYEVDDWWVTDMSRYRCIFVNYQEGKQIGNDASPDTVCLGLTRFITMRRLR